MKKPDYYQILEVSSDAKLDVIKDAWYKMAHKWHPDKNTSNVYPNPRSLRLLKK